MKKLATELDFDNELEELINFLDNPSVDIEMIHKRIKILTLKLQKEKAKIDFASITHSCPISSFFDNSISWQ